MTNSFLMCIIIFKCIDLLCFWFFHSQYRYFWFAFLWDNGPGLASWPTYNSLLGFYITLLWFMHFAFIFSLFQRILACLYTAHSDMFISIYYAVYNSVPYMHRVIVFMSIWCLQIWGSSCSSDWSYYVVWYSYFMKIFFFNFYRHDYFMCPPFVVGLSWVLYILSLTFPVYVGMYFLRFMHPFLCCFF